MGSVEMEQDEEDFTLSWVEDDSDAAGANEPSVVESDNGSNDRNDQNEAALKKKYGISEVFVSLERITDKKAFQWRADESIIGKIVIGICEKNDLLNSTASILLEPDEVIPYVNKTCNGVSRRNAYEHIIKFLQLSDLSFSKVLKCLPLYQAERQKSESFGITPKKSGRTGKLQQKMRDER